MAVNGKPLTENDYAACRACGHPIRHHETYPYLDGVVCKGRVNREWCKCPLTHDEALKASLFKAFNDGIQATIKAGPRDVIDNPYEVVVPSGQENS